MIAQPEKYIQDFVRAGADYVTVHAEATTHLHRVLQAIAAAGAVPGIALNPGTPPELVRDVLPQAGLLLIMTVNPGFGGQEFIAGSEEKIRRARALSAEVGAQHLLAVDGGITSDTAPRVIEAGARLLVSGSFLFGAANARGAINALRTG